MPLCTKHLYFQHMPQYDSFRNIQFSDTECGIVYHAYLIEL
jgi:hypothetical protein